MEQLTGGWLFGTCSNHEYKKQSTRRESEEGKGREESDQGKVCEREREIEIEIKCERK
jgi:hypothetical protein